MIDDKLDEETLSASRGGLIDTLPTSRGGLSIVLHNFARAIMSKTASVLRDSEQYVGQKSKNKRIWLCSLEVLLAMFADVVEDDQWKV